MRRALFFSVLFLVLVTLYGLHAQYEGGRRDVHRVFEKKEALIKIVQAWKEAHGGDPSLKKHHQLFIDRIRGIQSEGEDFREVSKEIILLEKSLRAPSSIVPVRGKIKRRPVNDTPSSITEGTTNVTFQKDRSRIVPTEFNLLQNYPNPFNSTTNIRYSVIVEEAPPLVTLRIYNILGQEVRTLVDEIQDAGYYTETWDGRDNSGINLSSGVYFYRFSVGDYTATKRMVLMK